MADEVYDKYIAQFRSLIENYGAQNAVYALEKAFELESEEAQDEKQKKKLIGVSESLGKLYYEIEKI
ncbi:hypothetical protein [Nitrosomonas sp.]|uniref:hypothetical protein n=1 Tax=Nitrosomonas sp. TaxID=42353 RepID=UPI0025F4DEA5|nr:hypothetical protein [Nitrosomonas sp.]MBY0484600.1 hypothetical protein [Nitrosomonas sp.]